jgi:hypothetical protein
MIDRTESALDYCSVRESVLTIENCIYPYGERSEYYELYEENFCYLTTIAGDLERELEDPSPMFLLNSIGKIGDVEDAWNTVIATLEDTPLNTLSKIDPDIDEMVIDPDEIRRVINKYRAKLERLPKKEMLDVMLWVMSTLMKYLEVKAAYDTLFSVLEELENNNSMLKKNNNLVLPEAAWVL